MHLAFEIPPGDGAAGQVNPGDLASGWLVLRRLRLPRLVLSGYRGWP
jgi:hypothetical protein